MVNILLRSLCQVIDGLTPLSGLSLYGVTPAALANGLKLQELDFKDRRAHRVRKENRA